MSYTPKSIHHMAHRLGMNECAYRDELKSTYNVSRARDLNPEQLQELGYRLSQRLTPRHSNMGGRPVNMASPAQLRAIEAMWSQVSTQPTPAGKRSALQSMCYRITGINSIRWITKRDVRNLIKAIQAMGAQSPEEFNKNHRKHKEASHG